MNLIKYWENAISFQEYISETERRISNPNLKDDHKEYYELGLQRMNRTLKTFKLDPEKLQILKDKNFNGKVLIISEPWCGDASTTVPVIAIFFEAAAIPVRIFFRDNDLSLINLFLTNNTQSIPIIILLDENNEVISHWGPRPKYGMQLLAKFKADPENYPREKFYNDLQIYYAKNKGKDVIDEVLQLI